MREIKFRAWDKEEKKMYKPMSLMQIIQTDDCMGFPDDADFMQYTGLKDKNGVEIYEGDIVKIKWFAGLCGDVGEIIFKNGMFTIKDLYEILNEDFELEIIGNIYENPDLIK